MFHCYFNVKIAGNVNRLKPTGKHWEQVVGDHKRSNKKSVNKALRQLNAFSTSSPDIKVLGTIVDIRRKMHLPSIDPNANLG